MSTSTNYLARFLQPMSEAFTPEMARTIVNLRADAEVEAHIGELREKANRGMLTPAEDQEYKEFIEVVDVLSIIQSKARQFLAKHSA